jgi:hypothetical protein
MTCAPNRHQEVFQRDDGLWSIGFGDDAPGPFESREFAMSVAGYLPPAPIIQYAMIDWAGSK